jgi:hypothetical protein
MPAGGRDAIAARGVLRVDVDADVLSRRLYNT